MKELAPDWAFEGRCVITGFRMYKHMTANMGRKQLAEYKKNKKTEE